MPLLAESSQSTAPDTKELANFRRRWREEIRERGQQVQPSSSSSAGEASRQSQPVRQPSAIPTSTRLKSAISTYALAVSEEQSGNYPEATRLYRNAFRLDANVDKAYHREEIARQRRGDIVAGSSLSTGVQRLLLADIKPSATSQAVLTIPTLTSLLETWPQDQPFAPEDDALGVPIDRLPDELIISILCSLAVNADANSIERFATVSRRARILSLDTSLWRQMVQLTIVPPQLSDPAITLGKLSEQYRFDYRRMFIEHPRLRLDGVYISICHYVRNGLGENPWVTVSHLITYRRFLRFLPNGEVLSYRANEDQDIGDIVRALQPGSQRKDLCIGSWQLVGTRVLITNLMNRSGHMGADQYSFQMTLTLKSRPLLGRWNKLDFLHYESVNIETGEICPFSLRHERPYWFSKVKSYQ